MTFQSQVLLHCFRVIVTLIDFKIGAVILFIFVVLRLNPEPYTLTMHLATQLHLRCLK